MTEKIQFYTLATPNGQKVSIALEEMGLEYDVHIVDIHKDEQFTPEFLAINPNNKIPAIVDPDGPDGKSMNVFESGAILWYLAEKTGKFLPEDPRLKWEVIEWLFFQMAGIGPMFGQMAHFTRLAKDKCTDPYPGTRYTNEVKRLLGVVEKRLEGREFLVDSGYSIADIAAFPWINALGVYGYTEVMELNSLPNVMAWMERCASRPATQKGLEVGKKQ